MDHPSKETVEAVADYVIPRAAREKAYGRPIGSGGLSRIYAVLTGWEASELNKLPDVGAATDEDELKKALLVNEPPQLFIPLSVGISCEKLEEILSRAGGFPKVVFLETAE